MNFQVARLWIAAQSYNLPSSLDFAMQDPEVLTILICVDALRRQ
jgi:hypothetical protein